MPFKNLYRNYVSFLLFSLLGQFTPAYSQPVFDAFIDRQLKKHPERFEHILKNRDVFDIQIIYTKVDRDRQGIPHFTTYRYRVDPQRYFYPAGTMGLAAAALALEKINNLNKEGLTRETPMFTLAARASQTEVYKDTTSENGLPSIGHYIRKLLVGNDHDAYNRLYEFLGQDYFNESMHAKGYPLFRATHRLDVPLNLEENKYTNPIRFELNGQLVYEQGEQKKQGDRAASQATQQQFTLQVVEASDAFPMDFQEMNAFNLMDQHRFLQNLIFPERAPEEQKLNLKPDDYQFLYRYLSQLPIETEYPEHYREVFDDASVKYLLFGKTKRRTPRQIRSFNKIGEGYGYLVDNAYIVDFEMGVEFFLSAVIYCKPGESLDGNRYTYDPIGYQFMADLGKTFLEYELARRRRDRPFLENFEVEYDK